jgi:hypothetical protein
VKSTIFVVALFALQAFGATAISKDGAYELDKRSAVDKKYASGTKLYDAQQMGAKGTWSYADQGGAVGQVTLHDAQGRAVTLPSGAIITDCMIDVVTQPTSGTSTATLSFDSEAAGDLKTATAVTGYTTSSRKACIPVGTAAASIKLTAQRSIKMTIASEAVTAGKVNVWVQYVLSE